MGKLFPIFWAFSFSLNNAEGRHLLAKDLEAAFTFSSKNLIWILVPGALADRDPMLWVTLFNATWTGNKVIIIHNLIIDNSLCSDCKTQTLVSFTLLGCFTNDLGWPSTQVKGGEIFHVVEFYTWKKHCTFILDLLLSWHMSVVSMESIGLIRICVGVFSLPQIFSLDLSFHLNIKLYFLLIQTSKTETTYTVS